MTDLVTTPGQTPVPQGHDLASWQPAVLWIAGSNTLATRRARLSACRQFVSRAGVDATAVRPAHVLAWKADMVDRGLAPRTIRQRLLILSGFFEWAIGEGYHPGPNPVAHVPLPSVGRQPVGLALDGAEVEDLVAEALAARDRALLRLLADGGLRAAELCALEERDARLHDASGSGELLVRAGKGGRPRTVTLGAAAAAALGEYLAAGPRTAGPTTPLFQDLTGRGRGIGYHTVYRVVRDSAAAAGLGHLTPHDLRRTHITLRLDRGDPLPQVQKDVGHSTMVETALYYRGAGG